MKDLGGKRKKGKEKRRENYIKNGEKGLLYSLILKVNIKSSVSRISLTINKQSLFYYNVCYDHREGIYLLCGYDTMNALHDQHTAQRFSIDNLELRRDSTNSFLESLELCTGQSTSVL